MRILIILFLILMGSSCDLTKRIFRKKEKTESSNTSETNTQSRTQLTDDWSWIGSTLYHRNGNLWVEFDGVSGIDISPTYGIRAYGNNARMYGNLQSSLKDTISEKQKTDLSDQTTTNSKESVVVKTDTEEKQVDKQQKTQKIAPILVLTILLILALLYAVKKLKPL